MTHALRVLGAHGVAHACHEYRYVEHGGTAEAARQLGVDEHAVIKTLVLSAGPRELCRGQRAVPRALLMLTHGDVEVSTRSLSRALGMKALAPCGPADAERATGYQVGGISPFGTRQALPVYVEASVLDLLLIYINGGRRGLLLAISPQVLVDLLAAQPVHARAS